MKRQYIIHYYHYYYSEWIYERGFGCCVTRFFKGHVSRTPPPCERLSRTSEGPRRLSQTRGRLTFSLSLIDVFHNSQ